MQSFLALLILFHNPDPALKPERNLEPGCAFVSVSVCL